MLCLKADGELALIAGSTALPLAELVRYRESAFSIDNATIRRLVETVQPTSRRSLPHPAMLTTTTASWIRRPRMKAGRKNTGH